MDDSTQSGLPRFLALVKRELHASDVRLVPAGEEVTADNALAAALSGGQIVAVFAETPSDRDALARRLAMLVGTFEQSVDGGRDPTPRPPATRSLRDELAALVARAQAADAVVIDAHSPVVWGAAVHAPGPAVSGDSSGVSLAYVAPESIGAASGAWADDPDDDDTPDEGSPAVPDEASKLAALSTRAVALVRSLPAIGGLRKGGRLHAALRDEGLGYLATSFASIYVLILVFPAPFDELRAERSTLEALPRIERLVLALPPRDPPPAPIAGVVAMRRPRRR